MNNDVLMELVKFKWGGGYDSYSKKDKIISRKEERQDDFTCQIDIFSFKLYFTKAIVHYRDLKSYFLL